ncbi:DinB family protein [Chloroflexota bacterium]
MELKKYIKSTLDDSKKRTTKVLDTLSQQEMMWRPACGCNSMGLILFHIIKSEDMFVQSVIREVPQIWESEKWYNKLNMAKDEAGNGYTIEQVNAFIVPDMNDLMVYYHDVRTTTLDFLDSLTPETFDRKVKLSSGEYNVAEVFSMIVSRTAQHTGEISYLRGMLRGMDK